MPDVESLGLILSVLSSYLTFLAALAAAAAAEAPCNSLREAPARSQTSIGLLPLAALLFAARA